MNKIFRQKDNGSEKFELEKKQASGMTVVVVWFEQKETVSAHWSTQGTDCYWYLMRWSYTATATHCLLEMIIIIKEKRT